MARGKRGFTLVELLVVISIIGILMALLLPAVEAVRENARQATCTNNLRELSLAMVSSATTKGYFPGAINPAVGSGGVGSWATRILPIIQKNDVYDEYTAGRDYEKYIELFVCPNDPPLNLNNAWTSYAANMGVADGSGNPPDTPANGICHNLTNNGPKVGIDYIAGADGTASTVLLAESVINPDVASAPRKKWSIGTETDDGSGLLWTTTHFSGGASIPLTNDTTSNNRMRSAHRGIIITAFADGHVQKIRDDITQRTYARLMTPDGSQASGGPQGLLEEADFK